MGLRVFQSHSIKLLKTQKQKSFSTNKPNLFWNLFSKKSKPKEEEVKVPILTKDNLFHPFLNSPIPEIKVRGNLIKDHGLCPTCVHEEGPTPTLVTEESISKSKRPNHTCPDCGMPTHCSEEHYNSGKSSHSKYCSILKEINEDEHDLRSGRNFPEFKFPTVLGPEATINLTSWDTFFVTRNFKAVDEARQARHVSKILTYPLTIASCIHPFGPHRPGKQGLSYEGQRSMAAIHYTMEQHINNMKAEKEQMRIFILGARAEGQLPPYAYLQLCYLFPNLSFSLHFIGPETAPPPGVPNKVPINPHLSFNYFTGKFHEYYKEAIPFDPYRDVFFLFHPGIGYPLTKEGWKPSLELLLETKCPIFITGYDSNDINNDVNVLKEEYKDEIDWLLEPKLNPFRSLKADLNLQDIRMTLNANHSIMGIRGKRYEILA
ncbi:hypothetical protein K502DRAFT_324297 [Neoconidiobolus thromboides FSU 785]|nr:hypothetical protein K502DRAFT_324297 [Neoconidiobolus thromboides FSU 785]